MVGERQRMRLGAISLDMLMTCFWLWLLEWGSRKEFRDHFLFPNQRLTFLCRCVHVCPCSSVRVCVCAPVCLCAYDELQQGTLGPLQTPFSRKHTVTANWISLDKVFYILSHYRAPPSVEASFCVSVCIACMFCNSTSICRVQKNFIKSLRECSCLFWVACRCEHM